jgi:pyruvate formate lyase activating enzyme
MIGFLSKTRFRRISILPYHKIAAAKYQRLGLPDRMVGVEPPSSQQVGEVSARFAAAGFDPHVGR